ncbi:spermatogenesis-associated protein 6 isoform X2 [Cephus cinctus]|uniref:Spermatogenesis-associated protein 6 isoform X2 n=1 Tax=Cephus cinctus TaxID=211228 RepID=A0AAJ7BIJ7_CEPCN|nr:spermatogenesis-associated protein 6 isoform X2 [Cephus cinctus]
MAGRGFCVKIELDLHAITCPGVWLCPNGKVALQINTMNSCIESHKITPIFPLLFHDKFTFKKVFTGVVTLAELQDRLENEFIYAELIQWSSPSSRGVILATFETNLCDLLYPAPCFKGLLAGVDVDLLMEPTKYFPGILAPKIEVSTRTVIEEVIGICDTSLTGAHIVNPKVIHSKNPPCFHRKRPAKGIIRQRRVCHSQGKAKVQTCLSKCRRKLSSSQSPTPCRCGSCSRCSRQKPNSTEGARTCSPCSSNRRSRSQSERCYHAVTKQPKCTCPPSSPEKSPGVLTVCGDSHIFESCPVCSKYKCYFACHSNDQDDNSDKNIDCKCKKNPPKVHRQSKFSERTSLDKGNSDCTCRPSSAPSPREDSSTSVNIFQIESKASTVAESQGKACLYEL